jgi:D-tyrosyl-tRNA(Tyr) deacylase
MKALIQRVSRGSVTIDDETVGSIGRGFVVLLGVREGDTIENAQQLAAKTATLRVFCDEARKMNLSLIDIDGQALVISQFTLYADTRKGNRPSFVKAAEPVLAERLYEEFVKRLGDSLGPDNVATGKFGAMMEVEIVNDGPVTVELNTDAK